ncbi:GNAT family N-acetyltransferase [Rhodococcus sp. 06-221-2]|uniref:GNAT family N-acetyltransferase n=1 Tax=Rhodococcus sp. 06-221-2 TaxID=2022514 RepID=UPI0015C5BFE8|nr:GNAT family N-acetyltransferase [Rhodococcus sp. 06-221-2]
MNTPDALTVRPCVRDDLEILEQWRTVEPVEWVDSTRLHEDMASGNYRFEWTWLAERAGRPVGRAVWWGRSDATSPVTLDCLSVAPDEERPDDVGAALVGAARAAFDHSIALEFNVDVPVGNSMDDSLPRALAWRASAAYGGGFTRTTERVSFARTADAPQPETSTRLRFSAGTDAEFLEVFEAVAAGSLDSHTREMVAEHGVAALAADDLAFYGSLPGRRESWQIAGRLDGTTVGFVVPTRNAYDAAISYLGVLPEHRGQGYVDDLLSEMVRIHHDDGQHRIVGTTDAANAPMRAAFERAGFVVTRTRIVHAG